jgi:hypothetical protein
MTAVWVLILGLLRGFVPGSYEKVRADTAYATDNKPSSGTVGAYDDVDRQPRSGTTGG